MTSNTQRPDSAGFTLMETIVATGILLAGLVTIASLFTSALSANHTNRQRTTATLLVIDKLEQLHETPLDRPVWSPGGSLTAGLPAPGYFDVISSSVDGSTYLRLWQIGGTSPRTVTVVVYASRDSLAGRQMEVARATTSFGPIF